MSNAGFLGGVFTLFSGLGLIIPQVTLGRESNSWQVHIDPLRCVGRRINGNLSLCDASKELFLLLLLLEREEWFHWFSSNSSRRLRIEETPLKN